MKRNAQAHHDLLWARADWFAAHGIDVSEPEFGRWVVGSTRETKNHPTVGFHQWWHNHGPNGSAGFTQRWEEYISLENPLAPYSRDAILVKMNDLRLIFNAKGIGR